MRRLLLALLLAIPLLGVDPAGVLPAHAGPYFTSSECPTNPDGSPVNLNLLTCADFETGWYFFGADPFGGGTHPQNNGWTSAKGQPDNSITPPGAYRCGAGVAIFGNCVSTGGPQGQFDGSVNIAHHWFWTPTCHDYANPYYSIADCPVTELYARWYVYWDFTAWGNTKFITFSNLDSVNLAFPHLFANDGGIGASTTNGELTLGMNHCDPPPSASGCTTGLSLMNASAAAAGFGNWDGIRHVMPLLRNRVYFMEIHFITDAKTGVYGSGVWEMWVNDCGTVKPLPAGACGASPTLRFRMTNFPIPGDPNGNKPTNILFDYWTHFANQGEGPFLDNLVVSRVGPIGFSGASSPGVQPPAMPSGVTVQPH